MKKNKGFTLVEVIVVAILLSILALGAFSLFMMYSNSARETTALLRLQRQSEALLDEIGRRVRESNFIFEDGLDTSAFFSQPIGADTTSVNEFYLFVRNDTTDTKDRIGGFRFENGINGIVMQYDNVWKAFAIDNGPLTLSDVDADGKSVSNTFKLNEKRQQVEVSFTLKTEPVQGLGIYYLTVERGFFTCRL
jgi:prepilin-type N-terminal cleavage/methylation domain-containing protein